jgi:hypothetical protein
MAITQKTTPGTIRGTIPAQPPQAVRQPNPIVRARPVQENRNQTVRAVSADARRDTRTALPHTSNAQPNAKRAVTPYAAQRLRWNSINGSGPVSDRQFIRAHGNDSVDSYDWVFRQKGNS